MIQIPKNHSEIKDALSDGMDEKSVTTYFRDIVELFVREIAIMTELKSHPNIVTCEDYSVMDHEGTIGRDILIRMELLTPLTEHAMSHKMTQNDVKNIAIDMCEALVFCPS